MRSEPDGKLIDQRDCSAKAAFSRATSAAYDAEFTASQGRQMSTSRRGFSQKFVSRLPPAALDRGYQRTAIRRQRSGPRGGLGLNLGSPFGT